MFPFLLLIADLVVWWLFSQVVALGEPLISIAVFGLAIGLFVWVVVETLELAQATDAGGLQ